MLKISIVNESQATICLQLEGSLSGPWVEELNRLSERALTESKELVLDLEKLRFVDMDGVALLKSLAEREVAQLNCTPFIREHLERESQ